MSDEITPLQMLDTDGNVVDLSEFMPKLHKGKYIKPNEVILYPPGALGELVDYYEQKMPTKNRSVALGACLAAVSAITQNKYVVRVLASKDTPLNLYVIVAMGTGTGKESGNDAFMEICELGKCFVAGEVSSGTALHKVLVTAGGGKTADNASAGIIIDEFGLYLKKARENRNSYDGHFVRMLLQIFGRALGTLAARPAMSSDKSLPAVKRPFVSLFATSTPQTLLSGLTKENVADGTLNRMIVIHAEEDTYAEPELIIDRAQVPTAPRYVPSALAAALRVLPNGVKRPDADPDDLAAKVEPGVILLSNKEQAKRMLALHRKLYDPATMSDDAEKEQLGRRVWELIVRVAGVQAAFQAAAKAASLGQKQIDESDLVITDAQLEWAEALIFNVYEWLKTAAEQLEGEEGPLERMCNRIKRAYADELERLRKNNLLKPGFEAVSKRDIMQKIKGGKTSKREIEDAIEYMKYQTKELIEEEKVTPNKQKTLLWRIVELDKRRPNF